MSVVDDLERRLENWARWSGDGGVGAVGVASIYAFSAYSSHYSDQSMPVINGEAMDTEVAIRKLDGPLEDEKLRTERPLQDALRARYLRVARNGVTGKKYRLGTDASEIDVAAALYVSYRTYLRRLHEARRALLEQLKTDRAASRAKFQA